MSVTATDDRLVTCLWFDGKAQEAAEFYVSVFPNSSLDGLEYYPEGSRGEAGSVLTASFTLGPADS